jgi:hypothetical protein
MLGKLRSHLGHNAVAYVALFVALGGSAYAANEWSGTNIQDETLTGADVLGKAATSRDAAVNGSLSSEDIGGQQGNAANRTPFVEGALTTWDLKNGTLRSDDIANDSSGSDNVNATKLDGTDSSGFVKGKGNVYHGAATVDPSLDPGGAVVLDIPGFGLIKAWAAGSPGAFNGCELSWLPRTSGALRVWWSSRRDGTGFDEGNQSDEIGLNTTSHSPDMVVVQAQAPGRSVTVTATVGQLSGYQCGSSAQAIAQFD